MVENPISSFAIRISCGAGQILIGIGCGVGQILIWELSDYQKNVTPTNIRRMQTFKNNQTVPTHRNQPTSKKNTDHDLWKPEMFKISLESYNKECKKINLLRNFIHLLTNLKYVKFKQVVLKTINRSVFQIWYKRVRICEIMGYRGKLDSNTTCFYIL